MKATIAAVATGGALGAVARFLLGNVMQRYAPAGFPLGTLSVNLCGALLIGLFAGAMLRPGGSVSLLSFFLITGFTGSLTTFSTYLLEIIRLLQKGHMSAAVIYFALSNAIGLLLVLVGLKLVALIGLRRALL